MASAILGDAWMNSPFRHTVPDLDALTPKDSFKTAAACRHPGDLTRFDARARKRVCVIGGGIAGLTAAYELLDNGHEVTLLEASGRFGGRILTHYFADGTYGELGAMRIPEDHGCVWHYIDRFGLATRPFIPKNDEGWCLFRDAPKMRRREWDRDWSNSYQVAIGSANQRDAAALIGQLAVSAVGTMTTREQWESLSNELTSSRLKELDATALGQHALGIPSRWGPLLSSEEWEFAGRTEHHIWLERCSLLHWIREGAILGQGTPKYEIVGGMDRLTRAFLGRIRDMQPGALALGAHVLAIDLEEEEVMVTWRSNCEQAMSSERFDYVICTVPAPSTSRIRFSPQLPPHKREALTNLSYIGSGKTIMRASKRHWELFDGIYGGTSVTDRPNQQCWYPSDNRKPLTDDDADHLTIEPNPDFSGDLLDMGVTLADAVVASPERSNEPAVFLAAYMWGTNAQRFASLNEAERDDLICRSVAELHPRNEQYLEDVVHIAWDAETNPGGGAFAFFAPGEQSRYQAALCAPLSVGRFSRVFFAGEHVGIMHGWIQSSIQTALAAVIDVLEAP